MRSLYVVLDADAADALRALARREQRASRQEAAHLILEGLRSRDLLPAPHPADSPPRRQSTTGPDEGE